MYCNTIVKSGKISRKKRQLLFVVLLSVLLCFSFVEEAYSADKSVIVGFHRKPGSHERALINKARGRVRRSYGRVRAMAVTLDEKEIEKLKKDSANVAYVEEDAVISLVDPVFSPEYIDSWGVSHIGAGTAHISGNRGGGVKVAILDTGVDYTHDELKDRYMGGYDFVFDDTDPYDDSWNSHGTHIAGIIAATQNDVGVVGVAPEADLYALKVLDGGGFGLLSWLIAAIEWAIENDMDIINMSLGGRDFQSLRAACDNAYAEGVLIVAAAGNTYGGEVQYPAAYDSVIAVGGTDQDDMKANFSPVGPGIELAAPSTDILSSVAAGGYDTLSGTSQAAAHVTGTAVLFYASDVDDVNGDAFIDNEDIRSILRSTAIDLGEAGPDDVFGFGLVDAAAASFLSHPEFEPLYLTLERTSYLPRHDMQTVTLSDAVYKINVENHGLKGIRVAVFQDGIYQKELSRRYRFARRNKRLKFHTKQKNTKTILLDLRDGEYELHFIPYGRRGTSADIVITEKTIDEEQMYK